MSFIYSVWNLILGSIFRSTYNPEAQAALDKQRQESLRVRQQLDEQVKAIRARRNALIADNSWQEGFNPAFDRILKPADNALLSTIDRPKEDWQQIANTLRDAWNNLISLNQDLTNMKNIATVGLLSIEEAYSNNQMTKSLYDEMKEYFSDLQTRITNFNNGTSSAIPDTSKIPEEYAQIQAHVRERLGSIGTMAETITTPVSYSSLQQMEAAALAEAEGPQDQFSFKRSRKTIWETVESNYRLAIYIVLGIMGGMLVANDFIGRSMGYRILFFIYGFLFGPIVCAYYFVRYMSGGKKPKIYTLLPIATFVPQDTLTSLVTYPFRYTEDGYACRAAEEFLNQSAAIVGIKREAKECPIDPNVLTNAADNLTKLKLSGGK
jgi:hypothetical protein